MNLKSRNLVWKLVIACLILGSSVVFSSAQGASAVRFVHVVPGAPAVDVYVNGSLAINNLEYGSATDYVNVPAGDHTVTVTAAGSSDALWEQPFTAAADASTTLIASSASAPQFAAFQDNLATTAFGSTRLLLVHALEGGPAVDVQLAEAVELGGEVQEAGTIIAQDMAYNTSFGAFDLPTQTYTVDVVVSGTSDAVLSGVALPLTSGTSYMAVVYGTVDAPQALLLGAPTQPGADSGLVRFAHGVVGAPDVDVLVNGTLIAPQLSPTSPTEHIALPAGDHEVTLVAAGTEDEIASASLSVSANSAQTAIALPAAGGATISVFPDDVSATAEGLAAISVINAVPEATATVSLDNGMTLVDGLASGDVSAVSALEPVSAGTSFTLTVDGTAGEVEGQDVTFYGGVYYNVILLPGSTFSAPQLVIAPTALAQSLGSAPGAGSLTPTTDTREETSAEAAPATEQPVVEVVTPAAQAEDGETITGRVLLDPSANLQLRQRPSTDAFSLGLAPSGTTLEVIGREGRPEALVEGEPEPPEAADFVDPAAGLAEDQDLDPATTWLYVSYETPDEGVITAWVLAQFLEVRDPEGDLQRLAELPTVPGNLPGEASGTELTPPPIPEDRVTATVFNLNPDARLNVRRTPSTDGEVLARLPLGTVVELFGFLDPTLTPELTPTPVPEGGFPVVVEDDIEWAFINYSPAEGGTITGWVSTLYVQYSWNGERIGAQELFQRDLVDFISPERRGEVTGGAQPAAIPTADPLEDAYVATVQLDPTANLQFRRSPDAQSESLNLIPSGTQLIVSARSADGGWLQTTFEGQIGWVSADFVSVTFNGDAVDINEIPVGANAPAPEATEESNG